MSKTFNAEELRNAYTDSVGSHLIEIRTLKENGEKYEEAFQNAHDFAEFVGNYLSGLGVLTFEDVEREIDRVKALEG